MSARGVKDKLFMHLYSSALATCSHAQT